MVEISLRIQGLIVRSFPYQPFNIQYRKGVEIPLADALSHVTPLPMEEDGLQLPIIVVNVGTANIPYSSNKLDNICEETRKDPTIKVLMHYISTGWPCESRILPQVTPILELLGLVICSRWTCYKEFQTSHTFQMKKQNIGTDP